MRIHLSLLLVPALFLACAADPEAGDELASTSAEDGNEADEVVSDEGLDATADALSGSSTVGATVFTTAAVNFREAPDGDVIRTLARGTAVEIARAQPQAGFYQVRHQGTTGWVHGAYLTTSNSSGRRVSTNIVYLGSCEFLGNCASAATPRAWRENKTIYYGCDGRDTCSDSEPYISVPRNTVPCGTEVTVCRVSDPSVCVRAVVREKSDSNQRYEASVATALGLDYDPGDGFYPAGGDRDCDGHLGGDGRVTIAY